MGSGVIIASDVGPIRMELGCFYTSDVSLQQYLVGHRPLGHNRPPSDREE